MAHRDQMAGGDDGAMIVAQAREPSAIVPSGQATLLVRVRMGDADAAFERALAHGARAVEPPVDREYGERDCTVADPEGHLWQLAVTLRDVAPEEFDRRTVTPWPAYESSTS